MDHLTVNLSEDQAFADDKYDRAAFDDNVAAV